MSQNENILNKQSGQGVVELVLILMVSVSVVLGVVYQLNDAFGNYAKNYFGEYVACLLESGELPSLGGSGGVSSNQCNTLFQAFTIQNGRPLIGAGVGEGGSAESSSANARRQAAANARAGGSGGPGSGSFFGGRKSFRSKSRFTPTGSGGSSESTYTGSTDGDISGLLGGRSKKIKVKIGGFTRYDSINYADRKKKKVSSAALKKRKLLSEEGELKQRAVRIAVNRKVAQQQKQKSDLKLSFGDYLKYLIIIALVIMLLLFFGNQAMQISKSME